MSSSCNQKCITYDKTNNISSKLLLICTPKLSGFSIVFMTSTAVTMLVANNHCF